VNSLSEEIMALLKGKFPNIKKMKVAQLKEEIQMWRNIWQWVPSEVKYYISRTGQMIGVQIRNYKRFIGTLLETYWEIKELEIGCYDKVYDQVSGEHFFEKKIVKFPATQIVALDWIQQRISETEAGEEPTEPTPQEEQPQENEEITETTPPSE